MSSTKHYNALILGSGQAGTPLATHIKSLGQTVCLVERSHIAGCCVNEGCTPTKTMVASGRIAHLARRAGDYGVHTGQVHVDMQKIRDRKRSIVTSFRGGSEKRLKAAGVDVLMGEARFVGPKEVEVISTTAEKENLVLTADKIFINVGCRPSKPVVAGLDVIDQTRILDSTSIQELGEVPKHLVVIGGGTIGLEFGQLFRRLGAKVTIVQRGPKLLGRKDDPELADCMETILKGDGVDVLLNATVNKLRASGNTGLPISVSVTTQGQEVQIQASHILVATGRVPNTDSLHLEAAGIKTTQAGHIQASVTLETNVQDIFALGDVKGGPAFTHVSYDDFRIVRDNLYPSTGQQQPEQLKTTDSRAVSIPSVTYTDPQFAHVGPKFGDLPRDRKLVSYSMPGSWIARGLESDETAGMLKAVVDAESGQIVSFSAISVEGGELMSVVQMAMLGRLTWMDLRDGVFAHPSWSEALNNLWGGEKKVVDGRA